MALNSSLRETARLFGQQTRQILGFDQCTVLAIDLDVGGLQHSPHLGNNEIFGELAPTFRPKSSSQPNDPWNKSSEFDSQARLSAASVCSKPELEVRVPTLPDERLSFAGPEVAAALVPLDGAFALPAAARDRS
jgi:hypothetical protein